VLEDGLLVLDVLANDRDIDGDRLTLVGGTQPPNGSVALSGTLLVYRPAPNFNGSDSFSYSVSDGKTTSNANVNVTVTPVNDAPRFTPGSSILVPEDYNDDGVYEVAWATNIGAGPANEREQLLAFGVAVVSNADLFAVPPTLGRDGMMRFTLAPNAWGTASIEMFLRDSGGTANGGVDRSQPVVLNIVVLAVNDAPIAASDVFTTDEDLPLALPVLANDRDPDIGDSLDPTTLAVVAAPVSATVEVVGGELIFTPTKDFNGTQTLEYRICDRGAPRLCDTARVRVTVLPVNDAPIAGNDVIRVVRGGGVSALDVQELLKNDSDIDSPSVQLTITGTTAPTYGKVALALDRATISYQQFVTSTATRDSFTYTLSDSAGGVAIGTVTIEIIDTFSTSSCENVTFRPSVQEVQPNVKRLRVEMINEGSSAITQSTIGENLLYINALGSVTETITVLGATSSDPAFTTTADKAGTGRFFHIKAPATAITTTFELTYTHTGGGRTSDDSFRARFGVGEKQCATSGQFPPTASETTPSTSNLQIEFINPAVNDTVITTVLSASFQIKAYERGTSNGTGVAFVAWRIIDQNGKIVYAWNEYFPPYCAFSDSGPQADCYDPQATLTTDWWSSLPTNATYRIDVYARGVKGDSTPVISRTFKKQ
jgi:large repetitive protein